MGGYEQQATIQIMTWLLTLLGSFFVFCTLGVRALWDPDEGRYAETAREMLALKDWIVPHLNYLPYLEKPPLGYWLTAFSFALFGQHEWAARLPCALTGLLGAAVTWRLGKSLFSGQSGGLAAIILPSSFEYYIFTQFLVLDMLFTFFFTASLWLFWLGYKNERSRRLLWNTAAAAAGLGALTKGPVALMLPGLIAGLFLWREGKLNLLKNRGAFEAAGIAILILLPWIALVQARVPGFLSFFFLRENVFRFLTKTHGRAGSPLYYVPVILAGFTPWTPLLPACLAAGLGKNAWNDHSEEGLRFVVLWFASVFIFFSFSGSKLVTYVLPAFPPLALLAGRIIDHSRDPRQIQRWAWGLLFSNGLVALTLFVSIWIHFAQIASQILHSGLPAFLTLLSTPLVSICLCRKEKLSAALLAVVAGTFLFYAALLAPLKMVEPYFTTRPLAMEMLKNIQPDDTVVSFDANDREALHSPEGVPFHNAWRDLSGAGELGFFKIPLISPDISTSYAPTYDRRLQSLPFYLKRRVVVIGALGELEPGADIEPSSQYVLSLAEFKRLIRTSNVFGVCRSIHYPVAQLSGKLEILARQADLTLFKNR